MSERTQSRGHEEARLVAALQEEGCPICDDIAGRDDHYFFWFFNESYYEPFSLDGLTRSLGFCLAHGARLARSPVGAYQLAAVHEVLTRRIHALLSAYPAGQTRPRRPETGLTACDLCPACGDRQQGASGAAFWLARLLEEPGGAGQYARPGILCFPHLGVVVPRVSASTFERLLMVHATATTSALASSMELQGDLLKGSPDERHDLTKPLLPFLRLAVGHDTGNGTYSIRNESRLSARRRDPVRDFLEAVARDDGCPVCLEVGRAWSEWIAWLEDAVPEGSAVEDLLPTCPEHVWATVQVGGAPLALATVRQTLDAGLGQIGAAIQTLRPPPRPDHETPVRRIKRALRGPRHRLRVAREVLIRGLRCPVCERLAVARDRALSLLFTLLEDRQHRAIVERGYGLCLKHFSRALALEPAPEIRAAVIEVEKAKLATLHWELEESLRKAAWNVRPEPKGAEQTAWRRAVLRFSGSLEQRAG